MKNFDAVTATGTIYEARDGILTIKQVDRQPYVIKPLHFATVDRRKVSGLADLVELPNADLPVVGLSLYASGRSEWRLSTPITEVKELT